MISEIDHFIRRSVRVLRGALGQPGSGHVGQVDGELGGRTAGSGGRQLQDNGVAAQHLKN